MRGGDEFRGWGIDRYMTANLIDAVRDLTFIFIKSNTDKKNQKGLKEPVPTYRPEAAVEKKSRAPKQNMFAAMAAQQLRQAKTSKE